MHAIVHAADVQDRDGGALLMASLFGAFPFLIKLYADGGYQGPEFQSAVKRILARVNVEIVKRSDQATGFVALPKCLIVERTFAWLGRCRRLAKDWECLNHKALAFLRLPVSPSASCCENYAIPHDVLGTDSPSSSSLVGFFWVHRSPATDDGTAQTSPVGLLHLGQQRPRTLSNSDSGYCR